MDLRLAVKREYFMQAKSRIKKFEYREITDYWSKRLVGRNYDTVTLTLGYPRRGDSERELTFPYNGFERQLITHKHFGNEPKVVYAIRLEDEKCK